MIWVALTILIFTIVGSAALLRSRRGDALGIPLVAIGTFAFIYVIQPLELIHTETMGLFLSDWQITKALLLPALLLASFMWGWLHPGRPRPSRGASWDPRPMWRIGFASACVGLTLYLIFLERSGGIVESFSQAHGRAMAWTENTAYLYDGPWLMLSGSVMMIYGDPRSRNHRMKSLVPYLFLSIYLLFAILSGDRGPFFAVLTATFVSTSIARRKQVTLKQAAGLLAIVCCGVAILFAYRDAIHLGTPKGDSQANASKALDSLVGTTDYDQEHDTASQEFLFHAATLDTVDQTGKLEYGVSWVVFFVINPIPRLLWPEKVAPQWTGINWEDIKEHTSIGIAAGSAPGIVADLYARFHLLSALFMYALGFGLRRLFIAARNLDSPLTAVGYIMVYAVSLNMFAQGFGAIFVPLGYSMIPTIVFALASRRRRRNPNLQHRELMLSQATALHGQQWSS